MASHRIELTMADPDQAEQIAALGRATFFETFALHNSAEDMTSYLEDSFSPARIKSELERQGEITTLIAADGPTLVGYAQIYNQSSPPSDTPVSPAKKYCELRRLYILKTHQGLGLGKDLLLMSEKIAKQSGSDIWLGVWEKNEKALKFYAACGYQVAGRHVFQLGTDSQCDLVMTKEL